MAQALVKHLAALRVEVEHLDGRTSVEPYCGGVFTIFGHGNVAGMGEFSSDRTILEYAHTIWNTPPARPA